MNTQFILFHLQEAKEELEKTIHELQTNPDENEGSLSVAMQHLYHHLNTGWNGRKSNTDEKETDELFEKRRQFPNDINM